MGDEDAGADGTAGLPATPLGQTPTPLSRPPTGPPAPRGQVAGISQQGASASAMVVSAPGGPQCFSLSGAPLRAPRGGVGLP